MPIVLVEPTFYATFTRVAKTNIIDSSTELMCFEII